MHVACTSSENSSFQLIVISRYLRPDLHFHELVLLLPRDHHFYADTNNHLSSFVPRWIRFDLVRRSNVSEPLPENHCAVTTFWGYVRSPIPACVGDGMLDCTPIL